MGTHCILGTCVSLCGSHYYGASHIPLKRGVIVPSTVMTMPVEAEWAALRTKIAASAGATSGDWGSLSQSLRRLHVEVLEDLAAKTAQFDALESDFEREIAHLKQTDDADATNPLVQARTMEGEWVPEVEQAEEHFQQVMRLVSPATKRLQLLDARAKYFEAAIQVETRSRHVRDLAEQASTDALDAFAQLSLFAERLPVNHNVIRVSSNACRTPAGSWIWSHSLISCVLRERLSAALKTSRSC